jgi:hypothetical protein
MSETGSEMSLVGTTSRQFLRTYARHGSTSQLNRDSSLSRAVSGKTCANKSVVRIDQNLLSHGDKDTRLVCTWIALSISCKG